MDTNKIWDSFIEEIKKSTSKLSFDMFFSDLSLYKLDVDNKIIYIQLEDISIIKFLSASNNARGHAFNEVLYEEGIDEEILHVVVQPTEKLYTFQKQWINATNPWNAVENTWNNAPVYWWMRDTAGKTNYLDYIDQRNYGLFV